MITSQVNFGYDQYGFLPLPIFCGNHLLGAFPEFIPIPTTVLVVVPVLGDPACIRSAVGEVAQPNQKNGAYDDIENISQPYVRPIMGGKVDKSTKFDTKLRSVWLVNGWCGSIHLLHGSTASCW